MRALQVVRHARPTEALELRELEVPEPGLGQVRVKVGAASFNFNDIDRCRGAHTSVKPPLPFTLGMDVCGVVDATGEGAEFPPVPPRFMRPCTPSSAAPTPSPTTAPPNTPAGPSGSPTTAPPPTLASRAPIAATPIA